MAVDIRQIHIGSHVRIGGVRARVVRLTTVDYGHGDRWHILVRGISPDDGIEREVGSFVDDNAVQPISITPALLEELGFELRNSQWRKRLNDDGNYLFLDDLGDCWEVYVCPPKSYLRPQLYAKYLHELEGQLAYYGVELIPD